MATSVNLTQKKVELQNEIGELRYNLIGLINLCKELGNEDYENNVLVKDNMRRLKEKEQELEDLRQLEREEYSN